MSEASGVQIREAPYACSPFSELCVQPQQSVDTTHAETVIGMDSV